METILLILSFLALHYPNGLFRDTARRYENMCLSDKDFQYTLDNLLPLEYGSFLRTKMNAGMNPILLKPLSIISAIASIFLALLPLFQLLSWKWYWIILLNLVFSFVISQILAFVTTPNMKIYQLGTLSAKAITYLILGLVFYSISFIF